MQDIIKTKRLILRPPKHEDANAIASQLNDKDILRMTSTLPHIYFGLCADFWITQAIANRKRKTSYAYVIDIPEHGLSGAVELFENENKDWEIGYWLAKHLWGKGFMSEAVKAVLNETIACLEPEYITAEAFTDNIASVRVLEKLGFVAKTTKEVYSIARRAKFTASEHRLIPDKSCIKI